MVGLDGLSETFYQELSAGDFIWNWPKDNYKTIQINNYKFKLDKTNHSDTFAYRAQGMGDS